MCIYRLYNKYQYYTALYMINQNIQHGKGELCVYSYSVLAPNIIVLYYFIVVELLMISLFSLCMLGNFHAFGVIC